jgi:diguanylate cyclase (GGDEF)-like protein
MNSDNLKKNLLSLFFSYLLLVTVLAVISYKFFINDFISLEQKHNKNSIISFTKMMDNELSNLRNIINDYAKWDDTYDFISNANKNYIYNNFREDSNTLKDLGIDGILFVKAKGHVVYSKYNKNNRFSSFFKKEFELFLMKKLENEDEVSTLLNYNSKPFFVVKSTILQSDFKGEKRGHIIAFKFLDKKTLLEDSKALFNEIKILDKSTQNHKNSFIISFENMKTMKVFSQNTDGKIISFIDFYDFKNEFVLTLRLSNNSLIVAEGEKTILIFCFISSIILLFVFIVIYKNQKLIINQNIILNEKVEKRTNQLTRAYRTLKSKNKELYKIANTDFLTKIRNRANFFEQSIKLLKKSNKENLSFSVLMIDIDYFKKINDRYGHSIGDKVLIKFCEIVSEIIDKNMVFGRLGGEEFAISIIEKDEKSVAQISEKIREKCSSTLIEVKQNSIKFTVSVGTVFKQSKYETIDEILHKADELLYKAKEQGRNRVIRSL